MFYCGSTDKCGTKVLQIVSGMRTWPAECSKLGKTRIIEDANIRLVRNATFFEPNFRLHFHLKSSSVFLIILLITQTKAMHIAALERQDSLDPMQLLLVLFLTNRKTERIVDIDDHVHAGCRNHTRHNVEEGVLF